MSSKLAGIRSLLSIAHCRDARPICFRLLTALMRCAFDFALLNAGNNIAPSRAMMLSTAMISMARFIPRRAAAMISAASTPTTRPRMMTPTLRSISPQ